MAFKRFLQILLCTDTLLIHSPHIVIIFRFFIIMKSLFSIRRYTFTPFVHPSQPVFILTKPIASQCNVVFLKGIIR